MSITYLLYVNFGNKDRKNYNKCGIFSYIHTFFLHFLALAHFMWSFGHGHFLVMVILVKIDFGNAVICSLYINKIFIL